MDAITSLLLAEQEKARKGYETARKLAKANKEGIVSAIERKAALEKMTDAAQAAINRTKENDAAWWIKHARIWRVCSHKGPHRIFKWCWFRCKNQVALVHLQTKNPLLLGSDGNIYRMDRYSSRPYLAEIEKRRKPTHIKRVTQALDQITTDTRPIPSL
jgi:hypothetical protein